MFNGESSSVRRHCRHGAMSADPSNIAPRISAYLMRNVWPCSRYFPVHLAQDSLLELLQSKANQGLLAAFRLKAHLAVCLHAHGHHSSEEYISLLPPHRIFRPSSLPQIHLHRLRFGMSRGKPARGRYTVSVCSPSLPVSLALSAPAGPWTGWPRVSCGC